MAFAETDLKVSQQEIDDLKAALENDGSVNSFTDVLAEAETKVRDWTVLYTVPEETLRRIWRALALYALAALAGPMPPYRKDAADKAEAELKDIRDGKFPQYPLVTENSASTPVVGSWGSKTKVNLQ